jgi:hypothetical protein
MLIFVDFIASNHQELRNLHNREHLLLSALGNSVSKSHAANGIVGCFLVHCDGDFENLKILHDKIVNSS